MRNVLLMSLLVALMPLSTFAAVPAQEVDEAEVLRLGDMVQHVGGGIQATDDPTAYLEAMGPPASDADRWFISVLTARGCAGCDRLKKDFAENAWLRALAHPTDPKQSWAHFNVYAREDQSQSFRFENVRVASYPTVLVQPPLSGRYGDPSTVVFQGVYAGDPQKLARDISQAIRQYVSRLQESAVPVRSGYDSLIGIDPPWQPVPRVDPSQPSLRPFPLLPSVDVQIPPQPTPEPASTPVPAFPWAAVVTLLTAGFSLPAAIAVVVWLVFFIRSRRLAAGKQPYVDQATLDRVLELLKRLTDEPKKQSNR